MSSCPSCQKSIEIGNQHMGALFTCPYCLAVFFVGWDGQPEGVAQHEAPPVLPMESDASVPDPFAIPDQPTTFEMPENPPVESIPEEPLAFEDFTPETAASSEGATSFTESPMPVEEGAFVGGESFAPEASGGMGDVVDFGNRESISGPLTYTIFIKGLELAETFERLREALTDSRFRWEPEDLMSSVRSGCLELRNLSPTKASILINRIKYLPIEVSWRQEIYGAST